MRAIAADTVITVPAGTFHCVAYEWLYSSPTDYTSRRTQYFAKGVGLVKDITPTSWQGSTVLSSRVKVLTAYEIP